jgi:multidrug efflux pump subunit AcrA (membrane-fusion protein)
MTLWLYLACSGPPDAEADAPVAAEMEGTRVQVARVETRVLHEVVTAPGRTAALREIHVRAPFSGTLAGLSVVAGSVVRERQVVAVLRSSEAIAAWAGASSLRASAKSESEIAEAERAIALAASSDVRWPLEAPEPGVVLELAAGPGDQLSEGDDVLTLSPAGALYFEVRLSQQDVRRVHDGASAEVRLASKDEALEAVVRGVLPSADADALDVPVRLDLAQPLDPPVIGLFGEARIVVREESDALIVPKAAVLTDDIEGTKRVARVSDGKAHWIDVRTGATEDDVVQVEGAGLAAGDDVIVSGQVGLPEDAPVRIAP